MRSDELKTVSNPSLPFKPHLDIAEADDIAVLDLARLAVGDAAAVDEGAVGRARVGDEQRALAVHHERRVNLRDALVLKLQIVVGHAADAHATAAGPKSQRLLERAFGRVDTRQYLH